MVPGNGCDHGIKLRDRTTRRVSRHNNFGKGAGGLFLKRQDSALEQYGKHLLDGLRQSGSTLTPRQPFNAV